MPSFGHIQNALEGLDPGLRMRFCFGDVFRP